MGSKDTENTDSTLTLADQMHKSTHLHKNLAGPERYLKDYGFLATTDNIEIRSFQNILLENWSMVLLLMAPSLIFMKLKNHK